MLSKGKKTERIRRKSLYVEIMAIGRLFNKVKNRLDRVTEHCKIKDERATKTEERKRSNERIRAKYRRLENAKLRAAIALNRQNLIAPNDKFADE
jgi:hypothetical protein